MPASGRAINVAARKAMIPDPARNPDYRDLVRRPHVSRRVTDSARN